MPIYSGLQGEQSELYDHVEGYFKSDFGRNACENHPTRRASEWNGDAGVLKSRFYPKNP